MEKKKNSKELLKDSVIELVENNAVEKVTVSMICKNCGVSQRTFYNYFQDKYALITWVYTSVLDDVYHDDTGHVSMHTVISALVHNIINNRRFYKNAVRFTGQNNFMNSIFSPLRKSSLFLIQDVRGDTLTEELSDAVNFYILGCIGFMQYHLFLDDPISAKRTIQVFEDNIPPVLEKYL